MVRWSVEKISQILACRRQPGTEFTPKECNGLSFKLPLQALVSLKHSPGSRTKGAVVEENYFRIKKKLIRKRVQFYCLSFFL
jgi:hypothetical protein